MTMTRPPKEKMIEQKLTDDIDTAIYELPDPPKIEIGDPLLNVLTAEAEGILEDDYVNDKVIQEKTIEQIKDEYNFHDIKDAFDEAKTPSQLKPFLVVTMTILPVLAILSLNEDNKEFISFLCTDTAQNIMTNNSLSIHIKSGGIFYNEFNMKENFYNFLLTQQDESKQFILKKNFLSLQL